MDTILRSLWLVTEMTRETIKNIKKMAKMVDADEESELGE